jgi:hypothetical protein
MVPSSFMFTVDASPLLLGFAVKKTVNCLLKIMTDGSAHLMKSCGLYYENMMIINDDHHE